MTYKAVRTFEYRDEKLGDRESIVIETNSDVFFPTSTTVLLLRVVRRFMNTGNRVDNGAKSILDIGCGSGIIGIVLAKHLRGDYSIFASDISEKAVELTKYNADGNTITIECRCGSFFEPWRDRKFDIIVSDVPGMSETIARISQWYPPQIHCDTGVDGIRSAIRVIEQAPEFLTPQGYIFFPVLSLSREEKLIETARERFMSVELLEHQWYPLGQDLLSRMDLIERLEKDGCIALQKRGSRLLWATKIFVATNKDE